MVNSVTIRTAVADGLVGMAELKDPTGSLSCENFRHISDVRTVGYYRHMGCNVEIRRTGPESDSNFAGIYAYWAEK